MSTDFSEMLTTKDLDSLLADVCIGLGICLPPSAQAALHNDPPRSAHDFAVAVFRAEGLDLTVHRNLYDRVLTLAFRAFEQAAERTAATRTGRSGASTRPRTD